MSGDSIGGDNIGGNGFGGDSLGDNLGVMLGTSKGRFREPHLLMLMRSLCFFALTACLTLLGRWLIGCPASACFSSV